VLALNLEKIADIEGFAELTAQAVVTGLQDIKNENFTNTVFIKFFNCGNTKAIIITQYLKKIFHFSNNLRWTLPIKLKIGVF
jgi:hypothetical protein